MALGQRVKPGYPKDGAPGYPFGQRTCFWQTDPAGGGLATLSIETDAALAATSDQRLQITTTAREEYDGNPGNPEAAVTELAVAGSRVKWWKTGNTTSVAVLNDDNYLVINLLDLPDGAQDRAVGLARQAVSQLPSSRPRSTGSTSSS